MVLKGPTTGHLYRSWLDGGFDLDFGGFWVIGCVMVPMKLDGLGFG